jgi:putative ABC transport system substrate-binding protein
MNRRAFLVTVGAGIAATRTPGQAQQSGKVWRIAVLTATPRPAPDSSHYYNNLPNELRQLGYIEGQNLVIEWRYTEGLNDRRQREAESLLQWKPDLFVAGGGVDAMALRALTTSVPIVVCGAGDVVLQKLANSLSRPGGNVTGLQLLFPELAGKKLEIIKELVPTLQRLAILEARLSTGGGSAVSDTLFAIVEKFSRERSIQVSRFGVVRPEELEPVFIEIKRSGAQALYVFTSTFTLGHAQRLAELTLRHRLPDIHDVYPNVDAGGLISYGYKASENFRRAAHFVDKIFKGANPAELPIEQPRQFEMVINLKTAKLLGLTVPPSVLARADRVIQ